MYEMQREQPKFIVFSMLSFDVVFVLCSRNTFLSILQRRDNGDKGNFLFRYGWFLFMFDELNNTIIGNGLCSSYYTLFEFAFVQVYVIDYGRG